MNTAIRIHKLDEALSNQIAAGEVVERPGAALKELVENALDAEATEIRISIAGGGINLLEVIDNGTGIHPEDLPLSLDRHATSKLRTSQDLFAIRSWGFRGEALASIAAVSRLKISSRTKDFDIGREITCEATQTIASKSVARPVGTTVRIEELFFNTPARKKFLKSQAAETSYAIQTLYRLALGSPKVSFELWVDGEKQFHFPATIHIEDRITQIFHDGFRVKVESNELIPLENHKPDASISGFVLPASHFIPSTRGIFTYVNGRSVKDKVLQQAITAASKEILFGNNYPQIVLYLETAPENVDVNVHPTKSEVRFRNSNQIFGLIRSTLEKTLAALRPVTIPEINNEEANSTATATLSENSPAFNFSTYTHFHQKTTSPTTIAFNNISDHESSCPEIAAAHYTGPQFLGTLKNTYLVCQDEDGLLLVDQHAAHERITYEKLKKEQLKNIQSAPLLIPIVTEIPPASIGLLEAEFPRLEKLGLSLDRAGPSQIMIRSIPAILLGKDNAPRISLGKLIRDLADHFTNNDTNPDNLSDILLESILHTLATQSCHGSVRAGQTLSYLEAQSLLQQMSNTDFAGHCPHGRPTTVRLRWNELEKLFKRIV